MAGSLRDRFFTRQVARAITSPSAIVSTGAGASIGLLAMGLGPPGIVAAVVAGAAALAVRVGVAVARLPSAVTPRSRVEPRTLREPWQGLVVDAQQAQAQFNDAVRRTLPGPLRDRLTAIGGQIADGVEEAWRTAQAGNALDEAYRRIDRRDIGIELNKLPPTDTSPTIASTRRALQAQQATAARMEAEIVETRDQLRLLGAQLGEAVTRCIELSAGAYRPDELDMVEGDVTHVLESMEALRQATDATTSDGTLGSAASGTA